LGDEVEEEDNEEDAEGADGYPVGEIPVSPQISKLPPPAVLLHVPVTAR
jgi:hypothetical protein